MHGYLSNNNNDNVGERDGNWEREIFGKYILKILFLIYG